MSKSKMTLIALLVLAGSLVAVSLADAASQQHNRKEARENLVVSYAIAKEEASQHKGKFLWGKGDKHENLAKAIRKGDGSEFKVNIAPSVEVVQQYGTPGRVFLVRDATWKRGVTLAAVTPNRMIVLSQFRGQGIQYNEFQRWF